MNSFFPILHRKKWGFICFYACFLCLFRNRPLQFTYEICIEYYLGVSEITCFTWAFLRCCQNDRQFTALALYCKFCCIKIFKTEREIFCSSPWDDMSVMKNSNFVKNSFGMQHQKPKKLETTSCKSLHIKWLILLYIMSNKSGTS